MTLIVSCTIFTSLVGIATAYVMKRLDNIVKLYAQSISSMLMTICCFFLFPKRFSLDLEFIISLILTFVAIFLYESDNVSCGERVSGCYKASCDSLPKSGWRRSVLWLLIGGSLVVLLFLISLSRSALALQENGATNDPSEKISKLSRHLANSVLNHQHLPQQR